MATTGTPNQRTRTAARGLALAVVLALTACPAGAPTGPKGATPRPKASIGVKPVGPDVATLVSDAGSGIIGDAGAALISNNGGQLIGKVKIPTGVVANNGAALISDKGGSILANNSAGLVSDAGSGLIGKTKLRLLAVADAPAAGFTVTLCDAGGTPFKDAAGKAFTATTDASGAYTFPKTPRGANLIVRVDLPPAVGPMLAFVPDAEAGASRTADVDGVSTLATGFVLDAYVRSQARPREVLAKLPADVEAATRATVAAAIGGEWPSPRFDAPAIRAAVGRLRAESADVDQQLERVKALLVAGLADLGDGQEALKVSLTFPYAVARLSDGSLLIAERNADRVRRRWPDGTLTTFAGKAGARALGDGGKAEDAYVAAPVDVVVGADDTVYVADFGHHRVRRIDKSGAITTVAGNGEDPSGTEGFNPLEGQVALQARLNHPESLALDAQGRVVVRCTNGTYRLEADGTLKGLATDDEELPDALATGPDGTVWAYQHDSGRVSTLNGDRFEAKAGVPAQPLDGEARIAIAADGEVYLSLKEALWRWDKAAWTELPLAFRRGALQGLRAEPDAVVVADSLSNRVWRVPRAGGAGEQIAGLVPASGDAPVAPERLGLNRPTALAVDRRGNLYVADGLNNVVWQRRPDGLFVRFAGKPDQEAQAAGDGPAPAARTPIDSVLAVTALPDGRVLLVDGSPKALRIAMREVAPDGTMTRVPFPLGVVLPFTLTAGPDGKLLLTDIALRQVYAIDGTTAEPLAPLFQLEQPSGLVAAPDGALYVADAKQHAIFKLVDGKLETIAGGNGGGFRGDGGPATAAQLDFPLGLALDAAGRLHVSDSRNDRVRRVDLATGVITTVAGQGGRALAGTAPDESLKEPIGLAFDAEENLYVADSGHNQVKLVKRAALGP